MLVALLVCLIPTTIGGLLSAIGIAGMDRMIQRNVIAMSGRAVEAAGDVDVLLLDKTGTITLGNRQAVEFIPVNGGDARRPGRGRAAGFAGRRDARGPQHRGAGKEKYGLRGRTVGAGDEAPARNALHPVHRPDAHERCRSAMDTSIRKGAPDTMLALHPSSNGNHVPPDLEAGCGRRSPAPAARRWWWLATARRWA